jgi:predicted RNA-binding protein with PUA-like domain
MKTMSIGDRGFFYHSNAGKETGIIGEIEVRVLVTVATSGCVTDV